METVAVLTHSVVPPGSLTALTGIPFIPACSLI